MKPRTELRFVSPLAAVFMGALALQAAAAPAFAASGGFAALLDDGELRTSDDGAAAIDAVEAALAQRDPASAGDADAGSELALRAADRGKKLGFRKACLVVLDEHSLQASMPPERLDPLLALSKDAGADRELRLLAAGILARSPLAERASVRNGLLDLAVESVRGHQAAGVAIQGVLRNLYDDPRAKAFLTGLLDLPASGSGKDEKNSVLLVIQARKDRSQLDRLRRMFLDFDDPSYAWQRVAFAIAGIGGDEGAGILIERCRREDDIFRRLPLFHAIGASRSGAARDYLLEELAKEGEGAHLVGVLGGLSYLGDPDSIPALRQRQGRVGLSPHVSRMIERCIETIEAGGRTAPGMEP